MKTKLFELCTLLSFFALGGIASATTVTWVNPEGGNWSQATNWSPTQVPGSADTAVINIDGNYTVTLDVAASVTNLVLGAPGNLNTQTFSMNGQTLSLAGQATVNRSGQFNANGGNLAGMYACAGAMNWSDGQLNPGSSITIAINGVLTINLSTTLQMYGVLTNAGTVNWVGGNFVIQNDNGGGGYIGGINNLPGAVFNVQCDQTIGCACYGAEYFSNAGTVRKSASSKTTVINVPFNNAGTVDVQSGTLSLNQGGTGSGSYIAEAGATLAFGDGYSASASAVFSGAGTNLWMGGRITINGTVMTTNSILAGAGLSGSGSFSGGLTWINGEFAPGGTLTIATNGMLTINGNTTLQMYGALTNAGTVNWVGGAFVIQNANGANGGYIGGINNLPGAVFNVQCDQTIGCACYGYEYFNNAGTVRKSATVNVTAITVPFNNSGTVDVQSGTLSLNRGGTGSGSYIAEAGATLAVGNGYLASTSAVFSGAGTNLWMGGTITINGTVMTTNSILAGAGLSGSGSFSGGLTWINGEFAPGGTLTIATNGMLTINGNTTLQMYGALTNAGTVNWVGGAFVIQNANGANGGYIGGINNLPGAVFNVQCDQTIGCACYGFEYFNNAGMVRKSASANTAVINVPFNNPGTVDVQSGTLSLSGSGSGGGSFIAETGATLAMANNYAASSSSLFSGAGTNLWTGGIITINGSVTTTNSLLAGAGLGGSGSISGGSLGSAAPLPQMAR